MILNRPWSGRRVRSGARRGGLLEQAAIERVEGGGALLHRRRRAGNALPGDGEVTVARVHFDLAGLQLFAPAPAAGKDAADDQLDAAAGGRNFGVAGQIVEDPPRPGRDLAGLGVAAIIEIDAGVGTLGCEDKAHAGDAEALDGAAGLVEAGPGGGVVGHGKASGGRVHRQFVRFGTRLQRARGTSVRQRDGQALPGHAPPRYPLAKRFEFLRNPLRDASLPRPGPRASAENEKHLSHG